MIMTNTKTFIVLVLLSTIAISMLVSCSLNNKDIIEEKDNYFWEYDSYSNQDVIDYLNENVMEYIEILNIINGIDSKEYFLIMRNDNIVFRKNDEISAEKIYTANEYELLYSFMTKNQIFMISVYMKSIEFNINGGETIHYFIYTNQETTDIAYIFKIDNNWYYRSMANR